MKRLFERTHTQKQGRLGFREGECLVLGVLWWRTWIHVPPAASSTKEVSCYDTHKRHSLKGALRTFLWRFFFLLPSLQTPITITHRKAEDDLPTLPKPGASIKRWCFTGRWQPEQHTKKNQTPCKEKLPALYFPLKTRKRILGVERERTHKKRTLSARLVPQSNLTPLNIRGHKSEIQ